MSTVKDILCYDGVATGFDANSSAGYSILVLAGKYLYTFKCSSADAKPVLDSTKTVDLSAGGGGGGGSMFVITATGSPLTFDKTWKEITDAFEAGSVVVLKMDSAAIPGAGGAGIWYLSDYVANEYDGVTSYYVSFIGGDGMSASSIYAVATAEDGYPGLPN